MKKIFLILNLILILASQLHAQIVFKKHYKIKDEYKRGRLFTKKRIITTNLLYMNIRKPDSDKLDYTRKFVRPHEPGHWGENLKADLYQAEKDPKYIKVRFWKIKDKRDEPKDTVKYVSKLDDPDLYYLLLDKRKTLAEDISYMSIPFTNWEAGVITIPFKYYRKNQSDSLPHNITTDINAGFYFGKRWGKERFYYDGAPKVPPASFTAAIFTGPSRISINKDNVVESYNLTGESNELALSLGIGGMLSYRGFDVGLFGGWDLPMTNPAKYWIYSKRFYLGFGVGFSLNMLRNVGL